MKQREKEVQEMKRMENARKMARKLGVYEAKYKQQKDKEKTDFLNNQDLTKNGISFKGPHTKYRCDNCIHFIGSKCIYHNVKVTKHHGCYKFQKYRILSGGGFSPR